MSFEDQNVELQLQLKLLRAQVAEQAKDLEDKDKTIEDKDKKLAEKDHEIGLITAELERSRN